MDGTETGAPAFPEPRLAKNDRTLIFAVLVVGSFALGPLLLRPFPVLVGLHIALPWLVMVLAAVCPGDFTLSLERKNSPRMGLSLCWPVLAFASMFVFNTTKLIRFQQVLNLGVLPAALFFAAAIFVQRRCRVAMGVPGVVALLLFSVIFGCATVHELDILLDHSDGAV
jgi:hypothetical protein